MTYYLIYLKYYIYFFYEIIIFIFYIFLIVLLFINYKYLPINGSFAFNINILYTLKNKENDLNIEEISFSECFLQRRTRDKYYKFHKKRFILLNKFLKKYNYFALKEYFNELKVSGCVQSIHSGQIMINNKRYLKLYIEFNQIIKTIKVSNNNNLIISSNKLQQILKKHLGLPKNYKMLDESIKTILLWYRSQGFEWISIKIVNSNKTNNINIIIFERKVISTKINCKNYYKTNNYRLIRNGITSEIKLLNGYVLNKKKIDTKIRLMQKKYFLQDISYEVINNQKGLILNVNYSVYNDKYIKIDYSPCNLHNFNQSYKNFSIQLIIQLYKIDLIYFYEYTLQYILNLKFYFQYFYLINLKIYFINDCIYKYIQSLNSLIYHYNYRIYSFNLLWIIDTSINIKQRLFMLYLFNFDIQSEYYCNQYLKFIQKIYNFIYQYYIFFLNIQDNKKSIDKFLNKYQKHIFSNIFYYKVEFMHSSSNSVFGNINSLKIKINYYLFLYLNNYLNIDWKSINKNFLFCNLYINNKFHLNIKKYLLNFEIQYNIMNLIINKIGYLKMIILDISNINGDMNKPFFNLYINYPIYINRYNKLYLFSNYFYNMQSSKNKFNFLLGLGLQINIPLKNFPHIRLEYIINMKKNIYLFIDKYSI